MKQLLFYLGLSALLFSFVLSLELSQYALASTITGILIPLYTYPGGTWDQVIAAKTAHPSVPIVAIINPNNGSGNTQDPNYVAGIQELQSAGIAVLGYVHTNYANRDLNLAMNDTLNYKNWYNVDGILFDEMSNMAGKENYYKTLNDHAKSIGLSITIGNSGVDTSPSYIGTVDNIIIYDNQGLPNINFLGGWHTNYDKSNFSSLSYGVETHDQTFVKKASNYVGYVYMSNGIMPNPWGSVPNYFENLVSSIEDDAAVSVNSVANSNATLTGLWTEIHSGSILIKTGFTPRLYWLVPDLQYSICVGDYQNYLFDHWEDGSTQRCRAITITQNATLTAYYQTEITEPTNPVTLLVRSIDIADKPITGLWTTIYSGTTLVNSGFTPLTYTANANTQYTVCTSNYQNYVFDHWDDGSKNNCRTITPTQDTTLTSYYEVYSILTVYSVESAGNAISGFWTEIYSNGTVVESGFTPEPYMLHSNLSYVVCIADYQNYFFNHWEDGSTQRCRTINDLDSNLMITAYYSN